MHIQNDISLKPYNTFGIEAKAKYFTTFNSIFQLTNILNSNFAIENNIVILGGGSNVLLTKNVKALVLKNEIKGIEIVEETEKYIFVKAGAGELWHDLVMWCVQKNLQGIENLALIPGTVGAAPLQNIGAYGVELKDVFDCVEAYEIATQEIKTFYLKDCKFAYRESIFKKEWKDKYIIISLIIGLNKIPAYNTKYGAIKETLKELDKQEVNCKNIADAVIYIRQNKLPNPKEIGNAGSFFKNPELDKKTYTSLLAKYEDMPCYELPNNKVKIPAGWLIEKLGWKGYKDNAYGVHALQALVLVNYGGANGLDILNLSIKIINEVYEKFGIKLEREVNIW